MRFSLIVATKGRSKEVEALMESLEMQTFKDFEVIVSDQNDDDRIVPYLKNRTFPVTHVHSYPGAAHARNSGIPFASGEIITFPDDDCTYPHDLLEKLDAYFSQNSEVGVLCIRSCQDKEGVLDGRFDREAGGIDRFNVWARSVEFTIFIRSEWMKKVQFDPDLGVGAPTPWQAEEGPDLLFRMQDAGAHLRYEPGFYIVHEDAHRTFDAKNVARAYKYACGRGFLMRKHHYPLWFIAYTSGKSFLGCLYQMARLNASGVKYYWAFASGKALAASPFLWKLGGKPPTPPAGEWYKPPVLIDRIPLASAHSPDAQLSPPRG